MTKVLIVDDNAANLYMLRTLLRGHGFEVDEARNGVDALAAARASVPSLVVSDLLMPVLDGYGLLRQWRADEKLRDIPFLVYTATYTEPRDERLALALGADSFLIKPAEPDALMERVRHVLALKASGALPAPAQAREDADLLREYNEVVVAKLEKKAMELERANRALNEEIAERRRTEEALKLRDSAIQEVAQGILITDARRPENPIIYASAGVERITQYRPDEIAGRNCRFLQGKDTDPESVRTMRAAVAEGRSCAVELLNYRKDGTPFWNALSINPVRDESGAVAYFVGVQSDVTERHHLEDQLRQAQKMEAIGRLAGGVAHDFNNLLTIVYGATDQIDMTPGLDEGVKKSVSAINAAAERAEALTRQLLAFSRKTMLQPKVLDLNARVGETGKLLRRLIGEDIVISTLLDPGLAKVRADPGQIDQTLMNLAVNARDAMPGGGTLTIATANATLTGAEAATHLGCRPGPYAVLSVADTGSGMSPDVLAHIFEPFFTTKEPGKGTGLGLATVFGVVQQSGGCIHVESQPDRGTTFRVYLPAVTDSADTAAVTAKQEGRGTETILLVEDDRAVRDQVAAGLRNYGYTVIIAADGAEALRVAAGLRQPVDLVLTDVVMPNLGGPELAEALRQRHPNLRVLFMSGYTDDAVMRRGVHTATVAFIQKPYTRAALARKVREVLDGREPAAVG